MLRNFVLTLVAAGLVSGTSLAGEEATKEAQACPSARVATLVASWKTAIEAEKSGCPEEKAKLTAQLASAVKDCPIGSRMGSTIAFTKALLDAAVAADEACSKSCPLSQAAGKEKAEGAPCCEAVQLKVARTELLKNLQQLASFAAGALPGCDATCGAAGAKATASAAGLGCCSEVAARAEVAAKAGLCAEKAAKLVADVRAEKCDVAAAKTVLASIEGLGCEKKAGEIVAKIRAESCDEGAAKVVLAAADSLKTAACAKAGAATETAAKGFCAEKAAKIVADVRAEKCDVAAANTVLASIEGLGCEKKAGEIVAKIRAESCDEGAARVVLAAADSLKTAACATKAGAATETAAKGFCAEKAAKVVAQVRAEKCDVAAAKTVLASIEGLGCEKKAGEIVAKIRAESCDEGAAKVVLAAADSLKTAACAKAGVATETAAKGFCAEKAAKVVAAVRAEKCDVAAAKTVLASIEGLGCEKKAGEIVAKIRAESCDEGAAKVVLAAADALKAPACASETAATGEGCCADLLACAAKLKASWEKAPAEFAAMCPQKKQLMASVGAMSQKSKVIALLPETVMALADGFDALAATDEKLMGWAKANPEALKDIPDEAKKAFERQCALLKEGTAILGKVRGALKATSGPCCDAAKKTETALKQ